MYCSLLPYMLASSKPTLATAIFFSLYFFMYWLIVASIKFVIGKIRDNLIYVIQLFIFS